MRKLVIPLAVLALAGCYDDTSEVQDFMIQVKNSTPSAVPPIPEIQEFQHFQYGAAQLRSPFQEPKPEAIKDLLQQVANCLHPDPRRRKQPLEKYAVDNLQMRGTLGSQDKMWGLVQATDGTLHQVAVGQYMGLFHGRVLSVTENYIELLELIPDGAGCWKERTTKMVMFEPTAGSTAS